MVNVKALICSHAVALAGGFLIGKKIDADELAAYRSVNSDATSAWVKRSLTIGTGLVGTFFVLIGIGRLTGGTGRGKPQLES
mmetsp:Transcript_5175/g.4926  ORF Transcript_5175/g.4926 Transcript_5175/m.4926 type:complete len:82 (+) Transcript_5175:96-341(+)